MREEGRGPGEEYRKKRFMQDLFNKPYLERQFIRRLMVVPIPIWSAKARADVLPFRRSSRYRKPHDRWFDIVEEYSKRKLTVATDILPALSGLSKAFQRLLADQYCAGLWRKDIMRGLMWIGKPSRFDVISDSHKQPTSVNPRIPTWSWASISGR
jgi:hypothetical protein